MIVSGVMGQPSELLNQLGAATPGSLSTAIYFPEHPTKQFPAGDVVSSSTGSLVQWPLLRKRYAADAVAFCCCNCNCRLLP
jgi:hypothetical protein